MTAIISKPEQKRLDSCDMARPKWAEFHEQRGTCGCDAFKIDELAPNDAVRVENARQNGQAQGNTKLLGKYRFTIVYVQSPHVGAITNPSQKDSMQLQPVPMFLWIDRIKRQNIL